MNLRSARSDFEDCGITHGVSVAARAGERESGDHYVVFPLICGTLIAIVDGAGHGPEAAQAARVAIATVSSTIHSRPEADVAESIRRCHQALRGTRGVAMGVARFDTAARTLAWAGVGNVSGILLRREGEGGLCAQPLLVRAGCVGYRLPALHAPAVPLNPGDLLVLTTDGIGTGFADEFARRMDFPVSAHPQRIAEWISARHAKPTDDGMVLVVRWRR